ncbi:gene transfer agent family protein [Jannaschia pohangensis]|uniref:Phage tail tube protein, GTA-gp10 n=1 Tax=Jannaschia pohangensis TaxID=390807 RepID=A0A1I3HS67_9RHOB|nr:gene transfer agent family protein [Jannaschia pohangensis]SFI38473.1 Phage tail tube protein, GTA-gp10 [Jannaschia pohangensis]
MGEGNPYAGEVALTLDGERHLLKLTLGALAELEAAMESDSLVALVSRFETGAFNTRDVARLLLAGLRGGGWRGAADQLLSANIDGGPVEATRVAALLLGRAFALPGK